MLTEAGVERFEAISFCLLLFLGAAGLFRASWNGFRRDFPGLPALSRWRARGIMGLAGLVAGPVLALTVGGEGGVVPSVWRPPVGNADLAGPVRDWRSDPKEPPPAEADDEPERRARLAVLKADLWEYARTHGGHFPVSVAAAGFPAWTWRTLDPAGMPYQYVAGSMADEGAWVVAFEPGLSGAERLALFSDGTIRPRTIEAILTARPPGR